MQIKYEMSILRASLKDDERQGESNPAAADLNGPWDDDGSGASPV